MSNVETLVRDYAEHIDSLSVPVDLNSLVDSPTKSSVRGPRTRLNFTRGVAVGLAAFVVVLAVGAIATLGPFTPVSETADAGAEWSRIAHDEAVFGEGWMSSVTAGGPGLVAVGSARDASAAVWTSVDGYIWSRVPHDPAVFGDGEEFDSVLLNVTTGGPGLVAVGSAENHFAAVWTSDDGTTWSRVPHDDAVFPQGWITSVTVGGPGLVAVGGLDPGAAVWTSVDGLTWSRVPHDEAVFGDAVMNSVTVGGPGLVAVGEGPDPGAAVWTSVDGLTWSRVPYDPAIFDGAEVLSVTAGGPGLVAVGRDDAFDGSSAAVWTSVDGSKWSRIPHDSAAFHDLGDYSIQSVISGGPGLVAVGVTRLSALGRDASPTATVWTSLDGITWTRLPWDEEAIGRGQMNVVIATGPGLVAVGADKAGADGTRATVWLSES